eukprot:777644-Ditylum_brightwellii.AAC.1
MAGIIKNPTDILDPTVPYEQVPATVVQDDGNCVFLLFKEQVTGLKQLKRHKEKTMKKTTSFYQLKFHVFNLKFLSSLLFENP